MDVSNDKPSEATVEQKSMTGDATKNSIPVTLEKRNADQPKTKTKPALNYKSGTTQSTTIRSSSPPFIRASSVAAKTSVSKHAKSSSLSSPTRRRSAHSPPLSIPTEPSPPTSKSSSPPSSVSARSTTPARDAIIEKQNPSRRAFSGQAIDGLWPSIRSLSSSFQSEPFVHVSKEDKSVRSIDHALKNSAVAASERKRTPLKGRNSSEHEKQSRVVDQHRWPAMKGGKVSTMTFSRSMDLTDRIGKSASYMLQSQGLSRNIHKSSNEKAQEASLEATTTVENRMNFGVSAVSQYTKKEKALPSTSPSTTRPASPKRPSSSSRRTPSPSSTRPSSPSFSSNNISQIGTSPPSYNHISDIRKGIKGADVEDIHQIRLLCNRELQWHFVNSQAEVALANQKITAENIFNDVWNVTSELRDYVTLEKLKIETLKQEMNLEMLLRAQVSYLDDWIALEGEYSTSLFRTIEALKASTLRLPVTGGARVDVRAVKNAFSSAIDMMQVLGSPVCYLLSRIEGIKRLCCQLSAVVIKEKEMLDECRLLLATTSLMKVQECSLRAHILQQLRHNMLLS
ncbi:hypothetical protein KSP40_PGU004980 [Platanthera guangdongensis]|uniref:Uncharacterized protein n=1 Tax=Platanthera guangdongensis TaxID=2320717 RepID=A0ABR2M3Z3_9ASPA